MKKMIPVILVSLLTGCLTATKQSAPPPGIAIKCSYQSDSLKQTESVISPKIIADPLCNYYYKWSRTGKQGDGIYTLELIVQCSGRDGITEIRDIEDHILKADSIEFIGINDGFTTFRSLFTVSEAFLKSVSGSRKYEIYSGPRVAHEFSIQEDDIQGFLWAVNAKRIVK